MNLQSWLQYIRAIHPVEIELGLDRVRQVAASLNITKPAGLVVTIGGTNGKGSCVACLDQLLLAKGYRTGSCTSPHLHRFNERIQLNGEQASDEQICRQFEAIESARQDISLSYFEYTTLAALRLLQSQSLDVALLEVGLGGRLDAVNIIDADIAVITSIDLDHTDWLGNSREEIAVEKAGIARINTALVCGDPDPPVTIAREAQRVGALLYQQGVDFSYHVSGQEQVTSMNSELAQTWNWRGRNANGEIREYVDLAQPAIDLVNAATALQVLALLPFDYSTAEVSQALSQLRLAGRFELSQDPVCNARVILDVAHNPAAAVMLAKKLQVYRQQHAVQRVIAVIAMMSDKDIKAVSHALESVVDIWYIAQFDEPRCMLAIDLEKQLNIDRQTTRIEVFGQVVDAYEAACEIAEPDDLILVTGSFLTVAAVRDQLHKEQDC